MTRGKDDFEWLDELAGPERDEVDEWSELSSEERARLARLDAEIFGLLPYALEPVEPSPGLKEELMRRAQPPTVAAFPASPAAAPRWLMPLAAGLTAVALGLAGWMYGVTQRQDARIAELQQRVGRLSELEEGLSQARQNLQLVSSRGVEICPLRPVGAEQGGSAPYGLLFLAADHQHWYLKVAGLEPEPGRYYRVWFETGDGLVPAGNLTGESLELDSPTMPADTRAVHVSIEREPTPEKCSGDIVLYGDDMVRVL